MRAEQRISGLIAPAVEAMGFELVRVRQTGGQGRPVLQVMAEPADGRDMTVEDCAEISRAISALLDVEDPIAGAYMLEVSSPGIDRPLTRPKDFDRFAGFEARVELGIALEGRKRFRGKLLGREGDGVRLDVEGTEVLLPLSAIDTAKLVLTDELIAAHTRAAAPEAEPELKAGEAPAPEPPRRQRPNGRRARPSDTPPRPAAVGDDVRR